MNYKRSKWWLYAFLAIPVIYFALQLLPYYHVGDGRGVSLGSYFWFPEVNYQTTDFLALFYADFRSNDLIVPLLGTQFIALSLFIVTLILKDRGIIALILGGWGIFGLYSFLTTRSMTFSPVQIYGGYAGILMLLVFLAAIILSAIFFITMYINYHRIVSVLKTKQLV